MTIMVMHILTEPSNLRSFDSYTHCCHIYHCLTIIYVIIKSGTMAASPLYMMPTALRVRVPDLIMSDPFGAVYLAREQELVESKYIRNNLDIHQNDLKNPIFRSRFDRKIRISDTEREKVSMKNRESQESLDFFTVDESGRNVQMRDKPELWAVILGGKSTHSRSHYIHAHLFSLFSVFSY